MNTDEPNPEDVLHTLMWARALIKRGWMQNGYTNRAEVRSDKPGTRYCSVGAIYATTDCPKLHDAARDELVESLNSNFYRAWMRYGVVGFNDCHATKKSHIIKLYDGAIEAMQERIKSEKNP